MTTEDIIRETESFTIEQKQQLAYYLLFSTIDEDKREQYINLFHNKSDIKTESKLDDIYNSIVSEQFLDGYSEKDDIYNSL